MNRATAKKRREDPAYRKEQNEYWRIWNNARTGAVARTKGLPKENLGVLDARGVWEYLKSFIVEVPTHQAGFPTILLNGKQPSSTIARRLHDLKHGKLETITVLQADRIATEHDLLLWEIEEAGCLDQAA